MFALLVTAALAQSFSPAEQAAVQAMSARHDPPPCAQIPLDAAGWQHIAEQYEGLPWVPMRAAACLLDRPSPVAIAAARRWVADPAVAGFADLVLTRLDRLALTDAPAAAELARAALAGPHASLARRQLALAATPALRALATP
jgi:hypothetical protein